MRNIDLRINYSETDMLLQSFEDPAFMQRGTLMRGGVAAVLPFWEDQSRSLRRLNNYHISPHILLNQARNIGYEQIILNLTYCCSPFEDPAFMQRDMFTSCSVVQ